MLILPAQQIENEYGNIMGELNNNQSASQYIHWCADMANRQKIGVPWIMCQQNHHVPHNVVISLIFAILVVCDDKMVYAVVMLCRSFS